MPLSTWIGTEAPPAGHYPWEEKKKNEKKKKRGKKKIWSPAKDADHEDIRLVSLLSLLFL